MCPWNFYRRKFNVFCLYTANFSSHHVIPVIKSYLLKRRYIAKLMRIIGELWHVICLILVLECLTASYFVKIIWRSRWFCNPRLFLRLCIALFAVTEWWLLLNIEWFVLFLVIVAWSRLFWRRCEYQHFYILLTFLKIKENQVIVHFHSII